MKCQEHMFKCTPVILDQRYCNHRAKRVEVLLEVQGAFMITDYGKVHQDYFRDIYTLKALR